MSAPSAGSASPRVTATAGAREAVQSRPAADLPGAATVPPGPDEIAVVVHEAISTVVETPTGISGISVTELKARIAEPGIHPVPDLVAWLVSGGFAVERVGMLAPTAACVELAGPLT